MQRFLRGSSLDLSFNNIRHAPSLPSLTKVQTLYLVQNKIGHVHPGALDWCQDTMKSIELGGNRLRVSWPTPLVEENVSSPRRRSRIWTSWSSWKSSG